MTANQERNLFILGAVLLIAIFVAGIVCGDSSGAFYHDGPVINR